MRPFGQGRGLQLSRAEPEAGEGGQCAEAGRAWAGGREKEKVHWVRGSQEPSFARPRAEPDWITLPFLCRLHPAKLASG